MEKDSYSTFEISAVLEKKRSDLTENQMTYGHLRRECRFQLPKRISLFCELSSMHIKKVQRNMKARKNGVHTCMHIVVVCDVGNITTYGHKRTQNFRVV